MKTKVWNGNKFPALTDYSPFSLSQHCSFLWTKDILQLSGPFYSPSFFTVSVHSISSTSSLLLSLCIFFLVGNLLVFSISPLIKHGWSHVKKAFYCNQATLIPVRPKIVICSVLCIVHPSIRTVFLVELQGPYQHKYVIRVIPHVLCDYFFVITQVSKLVFYISRNWAYIMQCKHIHLFISDDVIFVS